MRGRTALLLALLPAFLSLLAAGAPKARAASVSGRSSTQALWYSDEHEDDHLSLAQYLRVAAGRIDEAGTLRASGYGSVSGDLYEGGGVDGRLYHLYLDKRGIAKVADVRVGRQLLFVSSGSALVDGARVDLRPPGPLSLTLGGGRDVVFGVADETTRQGDMAFAGQLSWSGIPAGHLNASWLVKYDENDLSRSVVGVGGDKGFGRYGTVYAQGRLDTISEVWSEILAGARTSYAKGLTAEAEFFRSIPSFEATSIYSVFAVNRYQEVSLRADYEIDQRWSVDGAYRNESYGDDGAANVGEVGVRWRRGDRSSVRAAAVLRNGEGGNQRGFELSGDSVVAKRYVLAAGYQFDVYRRDLMTGYESAHRAWFGAEARVRRDVSVSARLEDNINENWNSDLRGRLALNLDF